MNALLLALVDGTLSHVYVRHRRGNGQVWVEIDYHTGKRKTTMILTEEEVRQARFDLLPVLTEQALDILGPVGDDERETTRPEMDLED